MNNVEETGKDAPYSYTTAAVQNFFRRCNLPLAILSEKNPLPHCYSHTLHSIPCPSLSTNGKGESKEASIASACGEFVERFASGFFFAEYALQKSSFFFHPDEIGITIAKKKRAIQKQKYDHRFLNQELLELYDPDCQLYEKHLLDNNYDEKDRGILLSPFYQLSSSLEKRKKTYFPIALLNNLYVSNGIAAGNSRFECINQALSEIFERYVKFAVISEGIALPEIPKDTIAQFPKITEKIKNLENSGYQIRIKDASLGGIFPVICLLLLCPDGGGFASFGCSCRLDIALARTITEMLQGRDIEQLQGFQHPSFTVEQYAAIENLENHFINSEGDLPWRLFYERSDTPLHLVPWDFSGNSEAEFHHLHSILKKTRYNAYIQEFDHFPLHVCRIIIPGMSEIYPVEDLIIHNRNQGSWLRPLLLQLPSMKSKKRGQFLQKLEASRLPAESLVSHCIGIPFPYNSPWKTLRVGELQAMTILSLLSQGKRSEYTTISDAIQWCEWAKEYGREERKRLYHLLSILLSITLAKEKKAAYQKALRSLFSDSEHCIAEHILTGKIQFWGLPFAMSWEELSTEYRAIMKGHKILHKILKQ